MAELQDLMTRARAGDARAAAALGRALEGPMVHFVRRALRKRDRQSLLSRRIRAEASEIGADALPESPRLVNLLAHRLCHSLLNRVQSRAELAHPISEGD